ncbi:MAG: hypothetical protein JOY56_01310 [Solirubrobacterales bacterium]|nr:hypothetical protein [Solirubrobacterales bacterium]MBV8949078.1 hypothetical protein [Solirubrobacterales bacterium]MBV9364957.1 hypothetical protein [Solirubrobacterales bacterium]MBV9682895.1 hypothetical protein [Solirubrobacterales bacterium]MBV9807154.1 hypothetical protein [Solirubrobacterales bacterium]
MPPISHQTIKLSRGRHSSPEHGACVMELASMLAGEGFTDHPRSVSRPIASFLRGYNDLLDDRRRADLYRYAAQTVGTASTPSVEDARIERLLAWGDEHWQRRSSSSLLERLRLRRALKERSSDPEPAGTYAVHAIGKITDETHAAALALVDELIAMAAPASLEPVQARVADDLAAR